MRFFKGYFRAYLPAVALLVLGATTAMASISVGSPWDWRRETLMLLGLVTMHTAIWVSALVRDKELLKLRVADLEEANASLEEENTTLLKSQMVVLDKDVEVEAQPPTAAQPRRRVGEFLAYDLVYVTKDVKNLSMSHFTGDCYAIVCYSSNSEHDRNQEFYYCGYDNSKDDVDFSKMKYSLYLQDRGYCAWYPASWLTLVDANRRDKLMEWQKINIERNRRWREQKLKELEARTVPAQLRQVHYHAHFEPEAWVDDDAVDVDPLGPCGWDCTPFVHAHDLAERIDTACDSVLGAWLDTQDLLKDDPAAPEWVRDWDGPFTITVKRV